MKCMRAYISKQGHRKLLKVGGAEYIIRSGLYGEKLQSYEVTVKVGEAAAHPDPLVPTPMAGHIMNCMA